MGTKESEIEQKILLVDDEENVLKSLKRILRKEKYKLFTATSGEDGLKILKKNQDISLIISDQRMPKMTGAEFLKNAREVTPNAKRMILTGYSDTESAIDAINEGGAHRYISKPWNDEELIEITNDLCSRFILERELERLSALTKKQNDQLADLNANLETKVEEQSREIIVRNDELKTMNTVLSNNFKSITQSFSLLLGLRDTRAPSHSRNVTEVSLEVAKSVGPTGKYLAEIMTAAILHDIGKLGSTDTVLGKKPTDMNPAEFDDYKLHPVRGQTAVAKIVGMDQVGTLIRHHHECFDGSGFPDKLSGEEIPRGAKIIAIADYFDNTLVNYAGKNAITKTLDDTKKLLGKSFDPQLFNDFARIVSIHYKDVTPTGGVAEQELSQDKLEEDMIVSRDVRSGSGLLLMGKGKKLSTHTIKDIISILKFDPSEEGVFVWVN